MGSYHTSFASPEYLQSDVGFQRERGVIGAWLVHRYVNSHSNLPADDMPIELMDLLPED